MFLKMPLLRLQLFDGFQKIKKIFHITAVISELSDVPDFWDIGHNVLIDVTDIWVENLEISLENSDVKVVDPDGIGNLSLN